MAKYEKWFRISEWWNSKIVSLMGLTYFFILMHPANAELQIKNLFFLFIWMVLSAALGYYINDVFDSKHDALSEKYNYSSTHTSFKQVAIVSALIGGVLLDWHFLNNEVIVVILIVAQIMLFFLYSSPFLRLKENPVLGVVVDSLYTHLIPGIIVYFTIFTSVESLICVIVFLFWMVLTGLINLIDCVVCC